MQVMLHSIIRQNVRHNAKKLSSSLLNQSNRTIYLSNQNHNLTTVALSMRSFSNFPVEEDAYLSEMKKMNNSLELMNKKYDESIKEIKDVITRFESETMRGHVEQRKMLGTLIDGSKTIKEVVRCVGIGGSVGVVVGAILIAIGIL